MRNTKNAFTLVELIVVITILAILGTIAFMSFQGYTQEAKNTTVTSALSEISKIIEVNEQGGVTYSSITTSGTGYSIDSATATIGSGQTISDYGIGYVNFNVLGQNGEGFRDPNANDKEYIFAYASSTGITATNTAPFYKYQVAGEIIDNGIRKVALSGNYYEVETTDLDGLISDGNGSTASNTNGLKDKAIIITDNSIYR